MKDIALKGHPTMNELMIPEDRSSWIKENFKKQPNEQEKKLKDSDSE